MNKKIIPYLCTYLVLFIFAIGLLCSYPKAELHLMINSHHTYFQDVLFKYYTILAEWPLYIIAAIPLCLKKWRLTLWYSLTEGSQAILVSILKHIYSEPRPVTFFAEIHNNSLPLVEGVKMHHSNSFPSGHSSTFFGFFTFAALLLCTYYAKEKDSLRPLLRSALVQQTTILCLLLMAAVGCYSRVYLSQHFLSDIIAGSLIGVVVPCIMFYFFSQKITAK